MKHNHDGVILTVDQGTGSTKGLAIAASGELLGTASVPIGQSHPQPGWVEQDAFEIARSVESVLATLRAQTDAPVAGIALSTQRESAVVWDTATGTPLGPVLGWQDRRTSDTAEKLNASMVGQEVWDLSGLPVDAMFSALKFSWILDRIDPDRRRAAAGEITLGTVDAWLLNDLTGERRIERGNASRTQLVDFRTGQWSDLLLEVFDIPRAALPDIVDSDTRSEPLTDPRLEGAPVRSVFGDSHAALFGHGIRREGAVKVTYGTGSSVMGLTDAVRSGSLANTIAWSRSGALAHAFEGNILSTGGTLVWLADLLRTDVAELISLAENAPPAPVDLVPAFGGLAAPWWDDSAVGLISGLTLGTTRAELARAALESIALQIEDVLAAADRSGASRIDEVYVDGGPAQNDFVMQLQADLSGRTIIRPELSALSALGAAWLAGQSAGMWNDETPPWSTNNSKFEPQSLFSERSTRNGRWQTAIDRSRLRPTKRPDFTTDTLKEIS
ncbi:FGGY family carbohydrate kinase [Leifsonia sp. L25]|uniref:FGGY family carbohydrate kinase n=1 Tax=Actinomycetes TaxID=1760 RepID=UPI003D6917B9